MSLAAASLSSNTGERRAALGLKELKAKAVSDMLSVLLTAVSEDIAHLLGHVDIALSTLQA